MARAILKEPITDAAGNALSAQSVTVYKVDGTTVFDQVMYGTLTSSTPLANPLTSSTGGYIEAYATLPQRVKLSVSGVTGQYDAEFRVDPASLGQSSGGTAKFDGKQSLTATTTSGSNIITVPIAADFTGFTSADIGKRIVVMELTYSGGNVVTETNRLNSTITAVLDSTRVTAAANVSATLASSFARVIWGTDDTTAIQALFDTVQPSSSSPLGSEVRLPRGIAMVTSALNFSARYGTRLVGTGAVNAPNIPWHGTTIVGCSSASVLKVSGENLEIVGIGIDGAGKLAAVGLEITSPTGGAEGLYYSTFRQIRINACTTGLYSINDQFSNVFHDLSVYLCTDGVNLSPNSGGGKAIQKVTFYNLATEFCSANGIVLLGVENVQFFGGDTQNNVNGMLLEKNSTLVLVDGMQFEANTTAAINISRPNAGFAYGALASTWRACRFTNGVTNAKAVISDSAYYCTWDGCQFDNYPNASAALFDFTSAVGGATSPSSRFNAILPNNSYINNGASVAKYAGQAGVSDGHGTSARITNSGNVSIHNNKAYSSSDNDMTFDTVTWDPNVYFDSGTNTKRFVIQRQGVYRFTFEARFAASAGGTYRSIGLALNGSSNFIAVAVGLPNAAIPVDLTCTATRRLVAGDYVDAYAYQDSGGNLNVLVAADFTPSFEMAQVG